MAEDYSFLGGRKIPPEFSIQEVTGQNVTEFQFTHSIHGPVGYILIERLGQYEDTSIHVIGDTVEEQMKNKEIFKPVAEIIIMALERDQ